MPYCPNCGSENPEGARFCSNCGANTSSSGTTPPPPPPGGGYGGPQPGYGVDGPAREAVPNYLVQSILVTIFCCLPLGIAGIVFAAQANSKQAAGDHAGALEAARKAKTFTIAAAVIGIVVGVLWGIVIVSSDSTSVMVDNGEF